MKTRRKKQEEKHSKAIKEALAIIEKCEKQNRLHKQFLKANEWACNIK